MIFTDFFADVMGKWLTKDAGNTNQITPNIFLPPSPKFWQRQYKTTDDDLNFAFEILPKNDLKTSSYILAHGQVYM